MFWHAIKEGIKHATRSFWLSASAITVLTVSLGSVLIVGSVSTIFGTTFRQFDNQISIIAYFQEDVSSELKEQTIQEISNIEQIKDIEYIDNQEAEKKLKEIGPQTERLIDSFKDSNRELNLDYLYIKPDSSEDFEKVEKVVKSESYEGIFSNFQSTQELAVQLRRFYRYSQAALIIFIGVFGLISILVISNILRITIYNLREEIEIMRLVGATNNYIVFPFVAQSAFFSLISGIILALLFFPLTTFISPAINNWFYAGQESQSNLMLNFTIIYLVVILISLIVSTLISFWSTKKYLSL